MFRKYLLDIHFDHNILFGSNLGNSFQSSNIHSTKIMFPFHGNEAEMLQYLTNILER